MRINKMITKGNMLLKTFKQNSPNLETEVENLSVDIGASRTITLFGV